LRGAAEAAGAHLAADVEFDDEPPPGGRRRTPRLRRDVLRRLLLLRAEVPGRPGALPADAPRDRPRAALDVGHEQRAEPRAAALALRGRGSLALALRGALPRRRHVLRRRG